MSNLTILSKQTDAIGQDTYRSEVESIPRAYRPMIFMSVAPNPRATSNSVQIRSVYPLLNVVDGITTSQNQFVMVTKFTSLQHVTNDVERAKIFDDHIAFLQQARASILEGRLPTTAVELPAA